MQFHVSIGHAEQTGTAMDLKQIYQDYIACLNSQDWGSLANFVTPDVSHNTRPLGLFGYRQMLEKNFEDIPDLKFNVEMTVSEPPYLAARLRFHCTPKGDFFGLPINSRRVSFHENVFYQFQDGKIIRVRSVLDEAAFEEQL